MHKFSDFHQFLLNGFGKTSTHETVLENVSSCGYSTYVLGIRPSRIEAVATSAPLQISSASAPPTSATQEFEMLRAHLQLHVAELEAAVQSLCESSVPFAAIKQIHQSHCSIAHVADTLEHLQSFSV